MKVALDPCMFRSVPLPELPGLVADGIATVCVFAWEERARDSSLYNRERIRDYLAKYGHGT